MTTVHISMEKEEKLTPDQMLRVTIWKTALLQVTPTTTLPLFIMMILFAPLLLLLLVNMAMASENATTHGLLLMKTTVNDARWIIGSIIQASDSFACSIKCQSLFPGCQGFAWKDNTCFNIHILDTWSRDKSSSTIFIQPKDVLRLRLQDRVDKSGHAQDFDPKVYVHQKWGFVLSKKLRRSYLAREQCNQLGGQLPAVHKEATWNFFLHDIFPNTGWPGTWLGLDIQKEVNGSDTCLNEECNGHLIWNDGIVFDHQPFYSCITAQTSDRRRNSLLIRNKSADKAPFCPEALDKPDFPVTYNFGYNEAFVVCQIEIPGL